VEFFLLFNRFYERSGDVMSIGGSEDRQFDVDEKKQTETRLNPKDQSDAVCLTQPLVSILSSRLCFSD
jgi:hypothetical protein